MTRVPPPGPSGGDMTRLSVPDLGQSTRCRRTGRWRDALARPRLPTLVYVPDDGQGGSLPHQPASAPLDPARRHRDGTRRGGAGVPHDDHLERLGGTHFPRLHGARQRGGGVGEPPGLVGCAEVRPVPEPGRVDGRTSRSLDGCAVCLRRHAPGRHAGALRSATRRAPVRGRRAHAAVRDARLDPALRSLLLNGVTYMAAAIVVWVLRPGSL